MIESYLKRISNDVAVYWGNPVADSAGTLQYDTPREITCFWKGASENHILKDGREIATKAVVYVLEDLSEAGMLWLGVLTDLTPSEQTDPREVSDAYEIKEIWKTPSLSIKNKYARKIVLT